MASQDQFVIKPMLFASTAAGVKTVAAPSVNLGTPSQGNGLARQVPGNGSAEKHRFFAELNRKWVHLSYVLVDVVLVLLNGLVASYAAVLPATWHAIYAGTLEFRAGLPLQPYTGFLLLYAILIVLFSQNQDLYKTLRGRSVVQESWAVIRAITLATVVLAAFIFSSNVKIVSREVVGIYALLNVCTLIIWRVWKRQFVTRRVAQGIWARNVLIIGAGNVGMALARYLEENKQLGYQVSGFLDSNHHGDARMLGKIEDLARVARAQFVEEIFVTIPSERELVKNIAIEARQQHLNVRVIPELYDGLASSVPVHHLGVFPIMDLYWEPIPTVNLFFKRVIDTVVSGIVLVVLWPLFVILAVAIKLGSRGPVFYKSKRVGRKGSLFTCYKFRTMVANAEQLKEQLQHLNQRSNGMLFKIANDPRINRVGKFLRRYSLDELPQLWNVLRGDMSLVGPRPPLPSEFNQYSLEHLRRLDVRPGITGLWQVTARQDPSFESYMALDLKYIEGWSLWLDLKILVRTIPAVLRAEGH